MPGRKALCQLALSEVGRPFGHMVMKPGKFWFSVPRPYVTHEPMQGRGRRASPQFMSRKEGS